MSGPFSTSLKEIILTAMGFVAALGTLASAFKVLRDLIIRWLARRRERAVRSIHPLKEPKKPKEITVSVERKSLLSALSDSTLRVMLVVLILLSAFFLSVSFRSLSLQSRLRKAEVLLLDLVPLPNTDDSYVKKYFSLIEELFTLRDTTTELLKRLKLSEEQHIEQRLEFIKRKSVFDSLWVRHHDMLLETAIFQNRKLHLEDNIVLLRSMKEALDQSNSELAGAIESMEARIGYLNQLRQSMIKRRSLHRIVQMLIPSESFIVVDRVTYAVAPQVQSIRLETAHSVSPTKFLTFDWGSDVSAGPTLRLPEEIELRINDIDIISFLELRIDMRKLFNEGLRVCIAEAEAQNSALSEKVLELESEIAEIEREMILESETLDSVRTDSKKADADLVRLRENYEEVIEKHEGLVEDYNDKYKRQLALFNQVDSLYAEHVGSR